MAPAPRRRKIGQRRRLDEAEDEGLDALDDDTGSEATLPSDDNFRAAESDTSNVEESLNAPAVSTVSGKRSGNGAARHSRRAKQLSPPTPAGTGESNPRIQSKSDPDDNADDEDDDAEPAPKVSVDSVSPVDPKAQSAAPLIVSSSLASKPQNPTEAAYERRRREHEEYRKKRDADPAFVPNRGSFFMHDYRSGAPSGNGFRPFNRGRGGRGGRGGIGGPYAPMNQMHGPPDPLTSNQWAHDMHDALDSPISPRPGRRVSEAPQTSLAGDIPKCEESKEAINRHMSSEKTIGSLSIRVFIPGMAEPKFMPPVTLKQYTMLPDHRPPLRRDKPARIFLEGMATAKHIFPATDRSFIFIPRAMRPNQQRGRGKARSALGSVGGFSRRTSVFGGGSIYNGSIYGGSLYGGSMYSPSIAMSRRSSIAPGPDLTRDLISPAGSTISRPPMPMEPARPVPVVRLPQARPEHINQQFEQQVQTYPQPPAQVPATAQPVSTQAPPAPAETSITAMPQPQTHPLPEKPTFENRQAAIPMHQPTPKRGVSVENIESPTLTQQSGYQSAFHHQVPVQAPNPYEHSRQHSYHSQVSTGTPLSQIPEKVIHAAPFQPAFTQGGYYNPPQAPQMAGPQQPSFYYSPGHNSFTGSSPSAAPFVPGAPQGPMPGYPMELPLQNTEPNTQTIPGSNTVGMAVNGTVFYQDATQMPPQVPPYSNFQPPYYPASAGPPMSMGSAPPMGPATEGYYYPPQPQGPVYYPQ